MKSKRTATKPLTLKELKKSWWWRIRDYRNPRKGFRRSEIPWYHSDRVIERVAHNYELMRRCPEAKGFKPFLKFYKSDQNIMMANQLDRETATMIYFIWALLPEDAYRFAFDQKMEKERGWTNADPRIQWNLRLTDGALTKQFIKYINGWRRSQKVHRKRYAQGHINAKISWREIEILDRNQNHIGILNDSERHTASEALKKAAQHFIEFKRGRRKFLRRKKTPFDELPDLEHLTGLD